MATIEMRRASAARRAVEERVRPIRLDRGQYIVASSTHAGEGYVVHVDVEHDGTVACSCPAAQWEFPCKHAAAVEVIEQRLSAGRDSHAAA